MAHQLGRHGCAANGERVESCLPVLRSLFVDKLVNPSPYALLRIDISSGPLFSPGRNPAKGVKPSLLIIGEITGKPVGSAMVQP